MLEFYSLLDVNLPPQCGMYVTYTVTCLVQFTMTEANNWAERCV